jgi:exodeoxyribonuclease V gamma subunit
LAPFVHCGERNDCLVPGLTEALAEPLDDAFGSDMVSVPTQVIERWLVQRLSTMLGASPGRADGVCVNTSSRSPGHSSAARSQPP